MYPLKLDGNKCTANKFEILSANPSGTGLRIILFVADGYAYDKNTYYIKKGNIEVYAAGATNRFVTITGDVYLENKICENMDSLQWLLNK